MQQSAAKTFVVFSTSFAKVGAMFEHRGSAPSARVIALIAEMTTPEKLAQLQGLWPAFNEAGVVAPEMSTKAEARPQFESFAALGLGQVARVFGTKPVLPSDGLATLVRYQRWLADNTRHRIGVLAHEECLSGVAAWTATTYPTPLAWAATFDPAVVGQMAEAIGETMASLGVHQGLAPVLDVVRDARWGRVEETMGEDPYLIATLGKAYIEGIQGQGILATAKHFAGYSASAGGRNLAPAHIGRRELEDVFLLPFEVAVCDAHIASVMPAYVEVDGVPVHGDSFMLTSVLRDRWGFDGTVVADYFGVAFLLRQHGVVASLSQAAAMALQAGLDVELPTGEAFQDPELLRAIDADEALRAAVDNAVTHVLAQKEALGLLDIDTEIARLEALAVQAPDALDPPEHRAIASQLADESVILLTNDGLLPLDDRPGLKIALVGPNADRSAALFGCYSFVNHVLDHNPGVESRIEAPTVADAVRAEYPEAEIEVVPGCDVSGDDRSCIADAVAAVTRADAAMVVVGDHAGLFGKGTSGEGCDAASLDLPGVQTELVEAVLATGKPVVLVAVTGRPYAIGELAKKAAATLQVFFPGEAGAGAVAGVLSGRINPSGRLPVSVPASVATMPFSYLHPRLGDANGVSSIDPTPQFDFGFGLSYTAFDYDSVTVSPSASTTGWIDVAATVRNSGSRDGAEVVQVYGHDVAACVTRPVRQLLAYARVPIPAGETRHVEFHIPAARFALTDRSFQRVVEPGEVEVWVGRDCSHPASDTFQVTLTGDTAQVTVESPRLCEVAVS